MHEKLTTTSHSQSAWTQEHRQSVSQPGGDPRPPAVHQLRPRRVRDAESPGGRAALADRHNPRLSALREEPEPLLCRYH